MHYACFQQGVHIYYTRIQAILTKNNERGGTKIVSWLCEIKNQTKPTKLKFNKNIIKHQTECNQLVSRKHYFKPNHRHARKKKEELQAYKPNKMMQIIMWNSPSNL